MTALPPPSMYCNPPDLQLNLAYLSEVTSRRLKMLMILEKVAKREPQALREEFRRQGLSTYSILVGSDLLEGESLEDAVQEDVVSHFILRFRFCKAPTLRSWYVKFEWKWFKVRFIQAQSIKLNLTTFLSDNKLMLDTIIDFDRKMELRDKLVTLGVRYMDTFGTDIYEVKFQDAPVLVSKRNCVLEKGKAYFIDQQMVGFLKHVFPQRLNEALINLGRFEIDERINSFLSQLNVNIRAPVYSSVNHDINLDILQSESITKLLDDYSKAHYPLCMKFIHDIYKTNNHLRYYARMQYGLFIKGIGVPYEEALSFWEEGFTKKFTPDFYQREYGYLFRHQYGVVGSRIDYPPYKCEDIIKSKVCGIDQHGCPFAHSDRKVLSSKLLDLGTSQSNIDQLLDLVAARKYKKACAMYFNLAHGVETFESMAHPNEYFAKSQDLTGEGAKKPWLVNIPDIEDIFASDSDTM